MSFLSRRQYILHHHSQRFYSGESNKSTHEQMKKQPYYGHLDALKSYTSSWNKSSFYDFAENMFLRRAEHILEKTTYMEEMRKSKANVLDVQKKLLKAGTAKRSVMRALLEIRSDLNHKYMYVQSNKIRENHLYSVQQEIGTLFKMEADLNEKYKTIDEEEQLLLYETSVAINDAYEKEKIHTHFIKLLAIMTAVLSSLLGLIVSSILHNQQQKKMEKKLSQFLGTKEQESWGSYMKRNTQWMYSWTSKFR